MIEGTAVLSGRKSGVLISREVLKQLVLFNQGGRFTLANILVLGAILFIFFNLIYFFKNKEFQYSYFSKKMFYKLFFVLAGITVAFAVLYYGLGANGTVLKYSLPDGQAVPHRFTNYLYFSGVTILSVGYGDYLPVGHLRFFALIEAAIGLLLPSAYFMKMLNSKNGG